MNKKLIQGLSLAAILVVLAFAGSFFSCKKDGETKAFITVNDSVGNPVDGATVTLFQDTSINTTTGAQADVRQIKASDSEGHAEFVFALEAYLNITATKGSHTAKGFVRLKEHETVTQTVHF